MQLRKHYRKLSRNDLVQTGTIKNPSFVPRWQLGKTQEEIAVQERSRLRNPQDKYGKSAAV